MRTALKIAAMLLIALGCWLWLDTPSAEQAPASPQDTQPTADRLTTDSTSIQQHIQKSEPVEGADKPKPCMPPLVSGTRPAISEDAMAAWKNVLPEGPWTNSEVYVLLDAIDNIGVYAAEVIPFGQSASLDSLSKGSPLSYLSQAQLEARAAHGEAEAWRLLGIWEINSAWEGSGEARRMAHIERWKSGIEKLGQSAALGSDRSFGQLIGTTYFHARWATRRGDAVAGEMRMVMHQWHALAMAHGNATHTINAAANGTPTPGTESEEKIWQALWTLKETEQQAVNTAVHAWSAKLEAVYPLAPSLRKRLIATGQTWLNLPFGKITSCP